MINTWLAGAVSGILTVFLKPIVYKIMIHYKWRTNPPSISNFSCADLCNGILVGLVSITGCCDIV
jgi:hypothetical protein